VPLAQVVVALARLQGVSQSPQCWSVFNCCSQPFGSLPSQSPQVELQEAMWQLPPEQEAVALVREHEAPQELQLDSVSREVSHPLLSTVSQFPHSALQEAMRQLPPEQVAVALVREQETPQAPQFPSRSRDCSQPLGSLSSQSSHSASQDWIRQLPVLQVAVALAREQAVLQAPQCCKEFSRVSQPLGSFPSQLPQPPLQDSMRQLPPVQVAVALLRLQAEPQEPQSCRVWSEVSQPLPSFASQLAHNELHEEIRQLPPEQVAVAFARAQVVLQAPQSLRVSREVSHPSRSMELQLSQ
jgi:hypothetical protein